MSRARAGAVPEADARPGTLEATARASAEAEGAIERASHLVSHPLDGAAFARAFELAAKHLGTSGALAPALARAAEWFLDNYHLVRRVARQVEEELPRGFVHRLPTLAAGERKGTPRVDALARTLVSASDVALDPSILQRFVGAYQEVSALTVAELWALPTLLRAVVLDHLLCTLHALGVPIRVGRGRGSRPVWDGLDSAAGVERSIRALRVLDTVDWQRFFEQQSRVESILRGDPADVYAKMDFATCDSYRKAIETIAWGGRRSETEVADLVVSLARDGAPDERRGHVGFYLVGEGRRLLEERAGYRPSGLERLRRLIRAWPTVSYLLPPALLTALFLSGFARYAPAGAAIVALVPASALALAVVHSVFARLLPPVALPKLGLSRGIPSDLRTLVVIPTILGRTEDVAGMIRDIERHYLSNPDPNLQFALLTDDIDAKEILDSAEGRAFLEAASRGVEALNTKHSRGGGGPFHLLHRHRRWNPAEERFMGWERKRGKLEELNRLLRGDENTTYSLHVGAPAGLLGMRFVITLDSDTELPMGTAHRLVGLLAHPLNRAVFDPHTDRVVAGYTIAQPAIETSPSSARDTRFARVFTGDVGFDIYSHASSELYQDLFGAGIYVGKGIYDIDAFMRSVEDRAPENALVSHDLFEGIHGRTALATDIQLFEGFPPDYASFALRMHRWVRGDWQLLSWLLPKVPSANSAARLKNKLAFIDRWKIADNLRRSLLTPSVFALLFFGWIARPTSAVAWTVATVAVLVAPTFPSLSGRPGARLAGVERAAYAVVFLPFEAWLVADAIIRALVRATITRKRMLEWTSAAHTAFRLGSRRPRVMFWRTMLVSPLIAVATAAVLALTRSSSLIVASPLLLLWCAAPEIARWMSRPDPAIEEDVTELERKRLRMLARRTWRFFDAFVGPNDQWLPIDNYQEEPREQTAHRTSPTNIGLMLLATLSAYDFGFIGPSELSLRIRRAFDSITRMPHYQGHLFNWYDTRNLEPLLPSYVSTVDSGNFAGCLLAIEHGCRDVLALPVVRAETWEGLCDSMSLLDEVVASAADLAQASSLRSVIARMHEAARRARDDTSVVYATLRTLTEEGSAELDRELFAFVAAGVYRHEPDLLHRLRTSIDRLHHQLRQMRRELETLVPWLALEEEAAAHGITLPAPPALQAIPEVARRLRLALEKESERRRGLVTADDRMELAASARRLDEALHAAERNAAALVAELIDVAARADEEVRGMDFKLLYHRERRLFHIGYNVTTDQVDANYYDLLASEARLASYVAIVKHDVPLSHWYALGRPLTFVAGAEALLSWGGTMFEYLMPSLLMRSRPGTLLARTARLAVAAQIARGEQHGEPWGVSESAYARLDAEQTYQYRAFGVPGLGLKRGLEEDRVVTPYASLLALSIRPRAVIENIAALEGAGMLGTYGLYEALDATPGRADAPVVVRSYMAHHQGMLLVALGNFLNRRTMVDRFHSDPRVESAEMLLNERAPAAPAEIPEKDGPKLVIASPPAAQPPAPWPPMENAGTQAFLLSNGRLTSIVTRSGGGGLFWRDLALTRYEPDPTRDDEGVRIYVRDEESRRIWLASAASERATIAMHEVDLLHRNEGISVHVAVAVASADDVEVRLVTIHNETNRARRLTVTTAARPVLFDARGAPSHPAFSSLFLESELVADLDALVFARRRQRPEERAVVLVHRLVREGSAVALVGSETDRNAFFGRGGSVVQPAALTAQGGGHHGRVGTVLDPLMSLMASIDLKPKASAVVAFVTSVARSRASALDLARKYGSLHAVRWAFSDAEAECPRRLARARLVPELLPSVQRLFSALSFADSPHRAPPAARIATPPSQRRLWRRGISGDDPILVVRVHDAEAPLIGETIAAQRYLRSCGVRFDLVLLDGEPSGYAAEGSGTLRAALMKHEKQDFDEWLGRRGGIFLVAADQVPDGEARHLEACARAVLDTRDGTLQTIFERVAEVLPTLPRFEASLVDDTQGRSMARPPLDFDNGTGGFTADGAEYVLDVVPGKPTPAPWCNVLSNPEVGCLVSESSFGMTWSQNSGENRLTPWRNDPVFDTPSEVLYLRDEETAVVWSPTPLPAGGSATTRVRHGAGYTTYERESNGLVQELTVFVPPDAPLKIVRLRITNTLPRHRRLTATYYAEWVLGSRREQQRPFVVCDVARDQSCLLARCDWSSEVTGRVAFLASKEPIHAFTANRSEFLGLRGDYARPEALERWGLSGELDRGADPCAALQVHLELSPDEVRETHFVLGQTANRDEALAVVARFRDRAAVEESFRALHAYWDGLLGNIRVKTPEPAMDLMLNRWLLYQSLSSRIFGRTGFYQSSGAFGFRDQLQDVLAFVHAAPQMARTHILEAAKHQFEEGDVLHWWHPPSGRGVRTRCSDDMAWLPYVTGEYVSATGDAGILDEMVTFLKAAPLAPGERDRYAEYDASPRSGSLLEHCRRAIEHAATAGVHGLPLMGDGDWNDGMSRVGAEGRGESVWLAWFLPATMDRYAALAARRSDGAEAAKWRLRAESLRARARSVAWDGGWYRRAFHDDGSLVGSIESRECQIDSIAQSWAVLTKEDEDGGSAEAKLAVRAAEEQLVREADRLVLLFWPPFDHTLHDPGYVRAYPPGVRENGGQYTHAATWLGFAHAALGDGESAERIFRILNPALRTTTPADVARYRVEPYVLAGDIYSRPPWVGRGGWSWYTGAAAWMWRLGIEAILGLRKEEGVLSLAPCIPPRWSGFEAWIRVGEKAVHVVVDNPEHVASGIAQITVDGTLLEVNRIAVDPRGIGVHEVRVRLGSRVRQLSRSDSFRSTC